jgi:hypothetical protein
VITRPALGSGAAFGLRTAPAPGAVPVVAGEPEVLLPMLLPEPLIVLWPAPVTDDWAWAAPARARPKAPARRRVGMRMGEVSSV